VGAADDTMKVGSRRLLGGAVKLLAHRQRNQLVSIAVND
jgi:hypothetical protein